MEFGIATFQPGHASSTSDETLTVLEASRRAGVTQSAIVRWIRNGYLPATPSANGWQIPADTLQQAADAADEARGTSAVPRKTTPSLVPSPTPIRRSVETRASQVRHEEIGEHIVAPLAELIRDQIDVVHDQAEVIGWLQAERSRLSAAVEKLKSGQVTTDDSVSPPNEGGTGDLPADHELYDEVLSLLWKDDSTSTAPPEQHGDEQQDAIQTEEDDLFAPQDTSNAEEEKPLFDQPPVEHVMNGHVDDWPSASDPVLRIEDYADPSWFFGARDGDAGAHHNGRPQARLQPIVARGSNREQRGVGRDEDRMLHQMIDDTERKIAELWRAQEALRTSSARVIDSPEDSDGRHSGGSRWQRLWPLKR